MSRFDWDPLMRSSWVNNDGSCAALSPGQFRASSVAFTLLIFFLDITTNVPGAPGLLRVTAVTF
jgi:hypothetical protein